MSGNLQDLLHSIPLTVSAFSLIASPLIAVLAVIVGPLIQLRIAKKQIRSTTVSANRQAWINALRENLATIRAYSSDVRELRVAHTADAAMTAIVQEEARQAKILIAKVDLSLNPKEKGHEELLRAVRRLWDISDSVGPNNTRGEEWERAVQDFMGQAKSILKAEWERVKKGD
jgi:hypothetical protein